MGSRISLLLPLVIALAVLSAQRLLAHGGGGGIDHYAQDSMIRGDFSTAAKTYIALMKKPPVSPLAEYYLLRVLENARRSGASGGGFALQALEAARSMNWPVLTARVDWMLAHEHMSRGRTAEAEGVARSLGLIRDWAVIGPFENEGEAGFREVYGPEKDVETRRGFVDMGAVHQGKQGNNRWRVLGQGHPLHILDMGRMFRLSSDVCGYACTYVYSAEPAQGSLRLGSGGAVKIWLNGRPVHEGDTYRSASFDQDVIPVRLGKGWNEVMVKVCQKKGPWVLLLRITAPDGSSIEGLKVSPDPQGTSKDAMRAAPGEANPAAVDMGALGHLKSSVDAGGAGAHTLAQYAYMLLVGSILDENDRTARDLLAQAVEAAPDHVYFRIMLSAVELDRNRALEQAREARKLAPNTAMPAFVLSRFYGAPRLIDWGGWPILGSGERDAATQEEYAKIREVEMPERERALLFEALKFRPDYLEARQALASHFFRLAGGNPRNPGYLSPGQPFANLARVQLTKALALAGNDPRLTRMLEAFRLTDPPARMARARKALANDFRDAKARAELVGALTDLGRLEEAVSVLSDRLRLNPFDWDALREMAAAYRAWDRFERAAHCLEMSLTIRPENVGVLRELGDLYLLMGNKDRAVAQFRRALEISPQMASLERRLRHLLPETADEFYAPFRVELPALAKAALSEDTSEKVPAV
ncbi:MAG: tetratricopeptide repeat protein, partial [Planctomycetota bacterium]